MSSRRRITAALVGLLLLVFLGWLGRELANGQQVTSGFITFADPELSSSMVE